MPSDPTGYADIQETIDETLDLYESRGSARGGRVFADYAAKMLPCYALALQEACRCVADLEPHLLVPVNELLIRRAQEKPDAK